MQSVTLTRTIDAQPAAVTDAMADLKPFLLAAGFDEVEVAEDGIRVANAVGIVEIELVLDPIDDIDAALAYEQREGIFEQMVTTYAVDSGTDSNAGGTASTEVTASTEFALGVALVGGVLDATVIERQRRRELAAQLDWLAERCGEIDPEPPVEPWDIW